MAVHHLLVVALGLQVGLACLDESDEVVAQFVGAVEAAFQSQPGYVGSDLAVEAFLYLLETLVLGGEVVVEGVDAVVALVHVVGDHAEVDAADVVGLDVEALALDLVVLVLALAFHVALA